MKKLATLILAMLLSSMALAAQTRPVVLSWTASTSSGVTGYNIYVCTVAIGGMSCTPTTTGTPLATVTGTTYTVSETTQVAYGFSITAVAPACSLTTPVNSPCGQSAPVTVTYVPVPPQVAGETNVTVVVP